MKKKLTRRQRGTKEEEEKKKFTRRSRGTRRVGRSFLAPYYKAMDEEEAHTKAHRTFGSRHKGRRRKEEVHAEIAGDVEGGAQFPGAVLQSHGGRSSHGGREAQRKKKKRRSSRRDRWVRGGWGVASKCRATKPWRKKLTRRHKGAKEEEKKLTQRTRGTQRVGRSFKVPRILSGSYI